MFRRFTKRRNHSTLQARQSGNLTFNHGQKAYALLFHVTLLALAGFR